MQDDPLPQEHSTSEDEQEQELEKGEQGQEEDQEGPAASEDPVMPQEQGRKKPRATRRRRAMLGQV